MPPTSATPSSQPPWPPRLSLSSRSSARLAAEHAAAARAAAAPPARRPGRTAGRGRCSRRSATRCCCRSCRRSTAGRRPGVSHMSSGQASPTAAIAAPPATSCRGRRARAERPTARPRRARARRAAPPPSSPRSRDRRRRRPARSSASARPRARARRTTGRGAAEHQQRVRVVVARDRDGDRRQHERQAGDEAGRAAEPPPRQVVGERDGRDAHQRLRHEQAPGAEAEHARGQRLHPQRERRLVDRHHAGRVERAVQERVPAGAHRAHGGAVVLVGEAVAVERPQVEHAGQHEQSGELGTRDGDRARAAGGAARGSSWRDLRAACESRLGRAWEFA